MLDRFLRKDGPPALDHRDSIVVIGLGRFGRAVAHSLVQLGHDVLAVDSRADVVQEQSDELPNIVQADCTDPQTLRQLDVTAFAHVVVAIGTGLEASVLTVLNLSQMGAKDIWVKAMNASHGRIVERLGAHHVVYPEADMGERVAHLVTGKMIDFIEFDDGFAIAKVRAPRAAWGKPLEASGVRTHFHVTVVGIKRVRQAFIYAKPDTVVEQGDLLIVAGATTDVERYAATG